MPKNRANPWHGQGGENRGGMKPESGRRRPEMAARGGEKLGRVGSPSGPKIQARSGVWRAGAASQRNKGTETEEKGKKGR